MFLFFSYNFSNFDKFPIEFGIIPRLIVKKELRKILLFFVINVYIYYLVQ